MLLRTKGCVYVRINAYLCGRCKQLSIIFPHIMKNLLLTLLLLLPLSTQAASVLIDGISYNLYETAKTAEVAKGTYSGDIVIPATVVYNGVEYTVRSIAISAFYSCRNLTTVVIPNTVLNIADQAFRECTNLTSVTMPNSVANMGTGVFMNCKKLPYAPISESLKTIPTNTFTSCESLTSVVIPNSITTIESSGFSSCPGLTSVTIGNSVTSIGNFAFQASTEIITINCLGNIPPVCGDRTFESIVPFNCTVHVPAGCKEAYESAEPFNKYTIIDDLENTNPNPGSGDNSDADSDISKLQAIIASQQATIEAQQATIEALTATIANHVCGDMNGDQKVSVGDVNIVVDKALHQQLDAEEQ